MLPLFTSQVSSLDVAENEVDHIALRALYG
jgi:hypothetical protein